MRTCSGAMSGQREATRERPWSGRVCGYRLLLSTWNRQTDSVISLSANPLQQQQEKQQQWMEIKEAQNELVCEIFPSFLFHSNCSSGRETVKSEYKGRSSAPKSTYIIVLHTFAVILRFIVKFRSLKPGQEGNSSLKPPVPGKPRSERKGFEVAILTWWRVVVVVIVIALVTSYSP